MEKKQDEKDIVKTDQEERAAETPVDEEPEWLDEPESEEESGEEWLDEPESEEESGEEWLDEPEPEEEAAEEEPKAEASGEEEEWLDEPESEEESEEEWLDEPEPEEEAAEEGSKAEASGEEEEWLDEPESEEESEEEWLDEPDEEEESEEEWLDEPDEEDESGREESEPDEELSSDEEAPVDEEEEALAGIVASGMKGESTLDEAAEADAGGEWDDFEDFEDEEYSGGKKGHRKLWIGLGIAAAAVVAAYLGVGGYFWNHFQPNTVINGIECDYMTVDDLKDAIQDGIHQYELQIVERGGEDETLYGADFDLHAVYDNTLEDILRNQGAFKWPASFFREASTYDPGKAVEWNEEELQTAIHDLDCFDEAKMIKPEDAKIIFSDTAEGGDYYTIQPAEYGTQIDEQLVDELITNAVDNLEESIDLEQDDCYIVPDVTEKSPAMISACVQLNRMIKADITYNMVDVENVHISKEEMNNWLELDDDLQVVFNDEAMEAFVSNFADTYNTEYREHSLTTTWGPTVTVSDGDYGWWLDQEGEVEALKEDLNEGITVVREPTWSSQAVSHNTPDYGDTYVEINLTAQHLYYYKDGSLVIDSDFVSGRLSQGRETPTGIYKVDYKQRNATLKGEDYSTPVSFWMPFNGGVGMHDATWRGSFGGSIYVSNGSHGCINLPYSVAETIYNNIDAGCCVFVYKLDGTEGGAAGSQEETDTVSGSAGSDDSGGEESADDSGDASDDGDNEEPAEGNASDEEVDGDTGEEEAE